MQKTFIAVALTLAAFLPGSVAAAPVVYKQPLDAKSLNANRAGSPNP
jgi:hypothetical protein